jgi:hypothetical protein
VACAVDLDLGEQDELEFFCSSARDLSLGSGCFDYDAVLDAKKLFRVEFVYTKF